VHYHDLGEGETLVLLHGGGPGASAWSNFKQNLEQLAERFRVLLVDLPGYGRSALPELSGGLFETYASSVAGLLDQLGLGAVHLLGNSLGGGTSVKLVLDHPDRVDRLILMGPAGATLPILTPSPSEGLKELFGFYQPPGPSKERLAKVLSLMVHQPGGVPADVLDERFAAATEPDAVAMAQAVFSAVGSGTGAMQAEELWRDVHRIQQKTLITWGRDDRVLPLDGALFMLKYMPDARLHVFPNCGHWAQLEHAAEFNRLAIEFLSAP
jgi:pimeloyl-ACP methyl ester carboxylesterase